MIQSGHSAPNFCSLRRVAVHGPQTTMRVGEGWRHVHTSADDFDVDASFAFAGRFHCGVEFTDCLHARREPVGAPHRPWQFRIFPLRKIVVGPVWVFFESPLDEIAAVIENKDGYVGAEAAHASDLICGQLVRALAGNEDRTAGGIGECYAKSGCRGPTDRSPQNLCFHLHTISEYHW